MVTRKYKCVFCGGTHINTFCDFCDGTDKIKKLNHKDICLDCRIEYKEKYKSNFIKFSEAKRNVLFVKEL